METPLDLVKALGRQNMQDRLGITCAQGIYNRVAEKHFPASWFLVLSDLAAEVGVECPVHLFSFKVASTNCGDFGENNQPIPKDSEQPENTIFSHTGGES